eukprot:g12648.t2
MGAGEGAGGGNRLVAHAGALVVDRPNSPVGGRLGVATTTASRHPSGGGRSSNCRCNIQGEEWEDRCLAGFPVEKDRNAPGEHEVGQLELHCDHVGGGAVGVYGRLQYGPGQAGPTSCGINGATAVGGAADPAADADLFRRRAAEGLIVGAIVAAAIFAVYRSRRKPGRRRPQRSRVDDEKCPAATAASRARWWQPSGAYGRWIERGEEEEGDGEKRGADDGKSPERTRTKGGGGGGGDGSVGGGGGGGGEEHGGDEASGRVEGCEDPCPSTCSESADTTRASSPGPENDRERGDDVADDDDDDNDDDDDDGQQSVTGVRDADEVGEDGGRRGGKEAFESREADDQDRDASARGDGGDCEQSDEARAGVVPPKRTRTDSLASSQFFDLDCVGQSFRSESSTDEILAEADSLIADSKKASARPSRRSSRGSARRATATTTRTTKNADDAPSKPNSSIFAIGKKTASSSRSSGDPRRRKRARVYREVTGEEVDALVNLTQRALKLDPAALSEIAEDASLQKVSEDDLSAGELTSGGGGSSITASDDDEGASTISKTADSAKFALRNEIISSGPDSG